MATYVIIEPPTEALKATDLAIRLDTGEIGIITADKLGRLFFAQLSNGVLTKLDTITKKWHGSVTLTEA